MPIRSGRFKIATATTAQKVVLGRAGALYRILNSGEHAFTISDGVNTVSLDKRLSIDIAVSSNLSIESGADVPVEGMYEYLDTDRRIRSGRFRKELATTAEKHRIIDLRGGGSGMAKPTVYYRIFNSGEEPFSVVGGTTVVAEVAPEQSLDFEIPGTGPRDVYVRAIANSKEIEGIYDYLGQ
ncbi:hypothetical protein [Maioricimonas sp. JC845]|uniref:hypothetical protein n=1 Tax=Maioricimonas sp. JC845 TaxID=3232138 RepID=UPI0034575535